MSTTDPKAQPALATGQQRSPERCTACGRVINPFTAECGGCSD